MPRPRLARVLAVAHTHWDREWYHPEPRFRARLVALVDDLLDRPDAGAFLLDGQAILLDDYLGVRPDRTEQLARALRQAQVESGPWYVLADLLIPSGEALVRNLQAGRAVLERLGAHAPDVLYAPDAFGHPAMLPAIAQGFGLPLTVLWRGYGGARWPAGDIGSGLPTAPDAVRARWAKLRAVLAPRATLGVALLTCGADHHARPRELGPALAALAREAKRASGVRMERVALARAAALLVRRAARAPLREVAGELRDSYGYTWALQGTFGARSALKRALRQAERALLRDVEPWVALAHRRGGPDGRALVDAAWRSLLACHPHDTLCGTVVDAAARAAAARAEDVQALAAELGGTARDVLVGFDPDSARSRPGPYLPQLVVWNPAARARGGVARVVIERTVATVPVGPGSAGATTVATLPELPGVPLPLQVTGRDVADARLESRHHYPRNERVVRWHALAWSPPVAGYGWHAVPLDERPARALPLPPEVTPATGAGRAITHGTLRVVADARGALSVRERGRVIARLAFESQADAGDLYTASLVGPVRRTARCVSARVTQAGPLRSELETQWRVGTSAMLDARDHRRPARIAGAALVTMRLALDAGSALVRVALEGTNGASEHRLRVVVLSGLRGARTLADAAFGPVERVPLVVPARDQRAERPPATAPLHRWVMVHGPRRGLSLIADGLAEYEVTRDGAMALTLLRSVAHLSRNDLPERPGHAGWPVPVPEARALGPFEAAFGLVAHGPDGAETRALVEAGCDELLHPLAGETRRHAMAPIAAGAGATLDGVGLAVSAITLARHDGWLVLRAVNLTSAPVRGAWSVGGAVREARLARLDETPGRTLRVARDGRVRFVAPPRAIVTVLVR
ncbi:MAG: hypothetical protein HY275_02820 [Gemmatimonadetes bacterium]|nr:hypothetical protein [Gemmatimonadota bacterium]